MLTVSFATTGECDTSYVERMLRDLTEHAKAMHGLRFNFRFPLVWEHKITEDDTTAQFRAARKQPLQETE